MRRTNSQDISASAAEPDRPSAADDNQPLGSEGPASRYSPEQRELLEQGLRILARLIVLAYFGGRMPLQDANVNSDSSGAL